MLSDDFYHDFLFFNWRCTWQWMLWALCAPATSNQIRIGIGIGKIHQATVAKRNGEIKENPKYCERWKPIHKSSCAYGSVLYIYIIRLPSSFFLEIFHFVSFPWILVGNCVFCSLWLDLFSFMQPLFFFHSQLLQIVFPLTSPEQGSKYLLIICVFCLVFINLIYCTTEQREKIHF